MYKNLKINDFRLFHTINILLGKKLTVFSGRNAIGKSTILGILANSGEIKKKEGATYSGGQFRAEFGEIFHGSKKFDKPGSDRIEIDVVDENDEIIDYRKFRTSWQNNNGKDRFRIIPSKKFPDGKMTEAKMQIPVIYLGLSRLFPIGEANEEKITTKTIKFVNDEHKNWFIENYKNILSIYDNVEDINNYSIGETDKKKGVGILTKNYDYLSNSSGQDNLGQILMAILSFSKLKDEVSEWHGGLLLIDEIDATLHPSAQKRLIDLLINEARNLNIQVVVSTHSSDLLKHINQKTIYNLENKNNDIELYYLTNANRHLDIKRNPDFFTIENDLLIESFVQNPRKIKVYSEDEENRWFSKKILSSYLQYLDVLDVNIGCNQLLSLCKEDVFYFGNVLIILDGDVKDKELEIIPKTLKSRLNNIIKLPGSKRPEQVIYEYLLSLEPDHPYWGNAEKVGFTWVYFKDTGPDSKGYSQNKERERYKKWFNDHVDFFDSTNLYEYWAKDNESIVNEFIKKFIESYNSIADRFFFNHIDK